MPEIFTNEYFEHSLLYFQSKNDTYGKNFIIAKLELVLSKLCTWSLPESYIESNEQQTDNFYIYISRVKMIHMIRKLFLPN